MISIVRIGAGSDKQKSVKGIEVIPAAWKLWLAKHVFHHLNYCIEATLPSFN